MAPAAAHGNWGPGANCGIRSTPNEHCYAVSWRGANDLGSIDFANAQSVNIPGWESGAFATQEQWITFAGKTGWIEMGQLEGYAMDCCKVRPFFAEETPSKQWHIRIAEGSGTNVYAHYLIYDTEQNGIWRLYWGDWIEEERYGGWGTIRFQEQEAGTEAATDTRPVDTGRDEVARWANGSNPWYPWNNAGYSTVVTGAFCQHRNSDNQAEGNIEWRVGSC
jgi:hypothetical protein